MRSSQGSLVGRVVAVMVIAICVREVVVLIDVVDSVRLTNGYGVLGDMYMGNLLGIVLGEILGIVLGMEAVIQIHLMLWMFDAV